MKGSSEHRVYELSLAESLCETALSLPLEEDFHSQTSWGKLRLMPLQQVSILQAPQSPGIPACSVGQAGVHSVCVADLSNDSLSKRLLV